MNLVQVKTENGNIKKDDGRYDLYEADANNIPIKKWEPFRQIGTTLNNFKNFVFDSKIREAKKVVPNVSLNTGEKVTQVINEVEQIGESTMLDAIKKFVTQKVFQWVIKDGGVVVAALGFTSDQTYMIVAGVVSFVAGCLWSLLQTGKIALTPPSDFQKVK